MGSRTDMDNDNVDKTPEIMVQPKNGITPRGYQLEMVEESLKRNIIVAYASRDHVYSLLPHAPWECNRQNGLSDE